jgi:CheY-like chemotaxis protein
MAVLSMPHILLVDDDSAVMRVLIKALAAYRLTVACDGVEALRVIGAESVDLVVTDYLMPNMTGDELIGRLRVDRPALKALVITGHGDILDRERQPWWETERHLAKPFGIADLAAAVTELLGAA